MIRINLMNSAFKNVKGTSPGEAVAMDDLYGSNESLRSEGLKRLFIILAGPIFLFVYEEQNLPAIRQSLAEKTSALSELQAYNNKLSTSVAEIKKFKEDEALIEARIAALEKISTDRNKEIKVLDLIQTVIPDKAWLTRVQINPDSVNIAGLALSDSDVTAYLDSLSKSVLLMDVNLVSSAEYVQDGNNLKKFEISGLLERPQ